MIKTTFGNLNFLVNPGEFQWGVLATGPTTVNPRDLLFPLYPDLTYGSWRQLFSNNGVLYGDGPTNISPDGQFMYFVNGYTPPGDRTSLPFYITEGGTNYVDANFELDGTAAPEPGSFTLVGMGLLGAAWFLKRRK